MQFLKLILLSLHLLGVPVFSLMFDFQECTKNHDYDKKKASVKCNGNDVTLKDIVFEERSIASISSMELYNFNNITFKSTAQVSKISIRNTTVVSVSVSFQGLSQLTIESVEELTLKENRINRLLRNIERIHLKYITKFHLILKSDIWWPIDSLTLSLVDSFDVVFSSLKVKGNSLIISQSKINLENSTAVFMFTKIKLDNSVLFIHKGGLLNITGSKNFAMTNTNINLMENGSVVLFNSEKVSFEDCLFYGLESRTLKVLGSVDVNFTKNGFFLSSITNVLSLSSPSVRFVENSFDCNYCTRNKELLGHNLEEVGDVNYCYLNCHVTLNSFQKMVEKNFFCEDPNQFIVENKMCPQKNIFVLINILIVGLTVVLVTVTTVVIYIRLRKKTYEKIAGQEQINDSFLASACYRRSKRKTYDAENTNDDVNEEVTVRDSML